MSADEQGSAFYHVFNRLVVMNTLSSTRIHSHPTPQTLKTTIFALQGLPHVSLKYPGDELRLVAMATPYKMSIMNMKPMPQIIHRIYWEKEISEKVVSIACLSWLPAKRKKGSNEILNPKLAASFGTHILILNLDWDEEQTKSVDAISAAIKITKETSFCIDSPCVALQWINRQVNLISAHEQDLGLFHES